MKSMTGYGRGECAQNGLKITVELSAVNRRQGELVVFLPRDLETLEPRLRDEINRHIARGRITVRVTLHAGAAGAGKRLALDVPLAKASALKLGRLARDLKLPGPVTLELLLRVPGVLQLDEPATEAQDYWPATAKALRQAMSALLQMREREGAHLGKDLGARVTTMRRAVQRVQKQAPRVLERYRTQLQARLEAAGAGRVADQDPRLWQEVVYFTDRTDITEELTRLQSHFQQFEDCLRSGEPVGRTLDFLAQEMNREINTLSSKANDSGISREVVLLKTELEKFREQAQNVE